MYPCLAFAESRQDKEVTAEWRRCLAHASCRNLLLVAATRRRNGRVISRALGCALALSRLDAWPIGCGLHLALWHASGGGAGEAEGRSPP